MNNYQKPIIILNGDLSEGVYTASGDARNYELTPNGGIEFGNILNVKSYTITITNMSDQPVSTVVATVTMSGTVNTIVATGLWAFSTACKKNDDGTATITYSKRRGTIPAGGRIEGITISVSGKGNSFGIQ